MMRMPALRNTHTTAGGNDTKIISSLNKVLEVVNYNDSWLDDGS